MIFRRRKAESTDSPPPEAPAASPGEVSAETPSPNGPYDAADVDLDPADPGRVDLGGLVVAMRPDVELRLQVDEPSGVVVSALLVSEDSALELRPFAAPRREGIWADVRREIAAEATRRGGTASEQAGTYGTELIVVLPVSGPYGRPGTQTSRVVGVDGPRWLLRGTFMGRAAVEPAPDGVLEQVFRDVVVVRGNTPMAPRDPVPLSMPGGAQPEDPATS